MWTPPRDVVVPPPPWRKIALGALVVLAVAGGAVALIAPEIEEGKEERAEAERRKDAAFEAAKRKRLAEEGRPRSGRGERPAGELSPAAELRARRGARATTSSAPSPATRGHGCAPGSSTARCSRPSARSTRRRSARSSAT